MSKNGEIVRLNDLWRVVDDPLQWILVRRGNKNGNFGPWKARSFCTTRKVLLRCIREDCGDVDPAAVALIETWPERNADGAIEPLVRISREAA